MGKIIHCKIKARLENVEELKTNHPDHSFSLKLKCTGCGEISSKWHDVIESETFPSKTGRSENNYFEKCKMCARENSLNIVSGSNASYTSEDSETLKPIVAFECRGIEPVEYQPADGWVVKVLGSKMVFTDVDLGEKEWVEYDENIRDSVGIYDFEYKLC